MKPTVTYTGFDKADKIKQGNDSICYAYGYDHQRIRMEEHVGSTVRTKRYVGNCEYVTEATGNTTASRWITYLSGPTGLFAAVETENSTHTIHYILKDNLGSWTTITDGDGVVEQRLSFDAWGNLRNPNTWSGSFSGTPMFDRGFTGHEHLYDFGLINMNGRMYDPVMSGFLSVDQYVQSPGNSQNFNRYAYCLNNPLRYVDPDGEEFLTSAIIIGSLLVGAYSGGVLTNGGEYNPIKWDWSSSNTYDGMLLGGVFGGLSGFAGVSIAGMGVAFCNTASIAASSLIYSTGMHWTGKCTNFDYGISLSIGVASFDFTHGKLGYLGKRGNSTLQNIGYGFGALANLQDIITGFDGGSYQYQYEKTKGNIGHANIRQVSYDADGETSTIVKISVANQNRIHAKNKLDWLWKCNFKKYSGGGEHWLDVPEQGWERIPLQLNTKIVDWMYHNLENGKGLWGITETRFGINYGCVSYAARALWTTGVPTIPMINYLGPSVLWTQLAIRQFGIQVSPIIIGI
jgi:RHS repeat-associated protein